MKLEREGYDKTITVKFEEFACIREKVSKVVRYIEWKRWHFIDLFIIFK